MSEPDGQWPARRHEKHRYLHAPQHWSSQPCQQPYSGVNPTFLRWHDPKADATIQWSSRQHRKHRLASVHLHGEHRQLARPRYRLWGWNLSNISWWIAQLFVWGSVAWVVNGWFLFLPSGNQELDLYMAGYSALAGGTLFLIGAWLTVVEASNTDTQVNFPREVLHLAEHDVEAAEEGVKHVTGHHLHKYAHTNHQPAGQHASSAHVTNGVPQHLALGDEVQPSSNSVHTDSSSADANRHAVEVEGGKRPPKQQWRWWRWRWEDLGWWATFAQLIGATLFEVSVILGVPHVLPEEGPHTYAAWDATYWSLQTAGAWGFILSGLVFMLEEQSKWYIPALDRIGWHVGFWNFIGAVGFELSPIFGYLAYPAGKAQRWGTYFSTFWGGWAFLIGSYLQLLEALNQHPLDIKQLERNFLRYLFVGREATSAK